MQLSHQIRNLLLLVFILLPTFVVLWYQQVQIDKQNSNPEVYGVVYTQPKSVRLAPLLPNQLEALALNAYEEARGEGKSGMIAVTNTVHHRVNSPEFPSNYHDVIYQPFQFSWTNLGIAPSIDDEKSWQTALHIAELELKGKLPDLVNGARYYVNVHKTNLKRHKWVKQYKPLAEVGKHLYLDSPEHISKAKLKPLPINKLSKPVQSRLKSKA